MSGQSKLDRAYKNFLIISYSGNNELEHIILKFEDSKKPINKSGVDLELKSFADQIKLVMPNLHRTVQREL